MSPSPLESMAWQNHNKTNNLCIFRNLGVYGVAKFCTWRKKKWNFFLNLFFPKKCQNLYKTQNFFFQKSAKILIKPRIYWFLEICGYPVWIKFARACQNFFLNFIFFQKSVKNTKTMFFQDLDNFRKMKFEKNSHFLMRSCKIRQYQISPRSRVGNQKILQAAKKGRSSGASKEGRSWADNVQRIQFLAKFEIFKF